MDFVLLSTLLPSIKAGITCILVSYDIRCQWGKNLQSQMSQYSISLSFNLNSFSYWKVIVLKFHLSGHGESCQVKYNINYTKGAGRMDGECIEGRWSQLGSMVIWTRENRLYACRVIHDHWGSLNWQKLLGLRKPHSFSSVSLLTLNQECSF